MSTTSSTAATIISTGASFSRYDLDNPIFLKARREKLYDATVALNYTLAKGLVLRPQLTYLRNDSNVELYAYDKMDASVNLRYDF